ncbi:hypothetical protein EWM64_g5410 [Hericium alpestre]|uniref:Major facilitator superfamily (MFS) profile domain-containing protein n=1 Tax=Hericium alpestre TaxID=135208 RepID=A0A4Y9ZWR8_9AGAM|nr:hypothetical protein EWM64_g5410 [Hericium alpestre]
MSTVYDNASITQSSVSEPDTPKLSPTPEPFADDYPVGRWRAWSTVLGAWLILSCSVGMGLVDSGASIGGIFLSILLNSLLHGPLGFVWGTRITAFVCLALFIIGNLLVFVPPMPPRFAMLGCVTPAGLLLFVIFYGFFFGASVAMYLPVIDALTPSGADKGKRMGMAVVPVGVACLIGPPISGAVLGADYAWWKGVVFASAPVRRTYSLPEAITLMPRTLDCTFTSRTMTEFDEKRHISVVEGADEPEHPEKKARVEPAEEPPLPSEPLCFSALRWQGTPVARSGDDSPEYYAQYINAVRASTPLTPTGWSHEHQAFIYKAKQGKPIRFVYSRSTYIGTLSSTQMTRSCSCTAPVPEPGKSAFTATFDRSDGIEIKEELPFELVLQEEPTIAPSEPSRASIVYLGMPDLELHRAAVEDGLEAESSGEEPDSDLEADAEHHTGEWAGKWTRTFYSTRKGRVRTDRIEYMDGERTGKERLELYEVRATVMEIYVSPSFFDKQGEREDSEIQEIL